MSRRRALRLGVSLLALGLLLGLVIVPQLRSAIAQAGTLGRISREWLALGVAAETLSLLCYARLTQVTLHPARIGYGTAFAVDLSTFAVSHLVPAGTIVGAGLGVTLMVRAGVEPAQAITGKAVQSIASAVALLVLLAAALIATIPRMDGSGLYPIAGAVVVVGLAATAAAVRALLRHPAGFTGALAGIAARIPRLGAVRGERLAQSMHQTVHQVLTHGADRRATAGWATLNWMLDAAALWCCVRAFGHPLGLIGLFTAYGLAQVLGGIPITPAGLGVVEGIAIPVLVSFHTPHAAAVFGVTAWRLLNFWAPIPLGLGALFGLRQRHRRPQSDVTQPTGDEQFTRS